ncbi:MAG: NAD-dependent epimerase/dehydratase family protein [Chiayiivirga sp.]|nr:NAD-dependent epimerase/dehydratase family protein [Chiayiivirga sp.]
MVPALIRRFHEAKAANAPEVVIWGTGTPLREFLHADDLADALRVSRCAITAMNARSTSARARN